MIAAEEIITQLKEARRHQGLTQRDLSAKAGVPQSHISKIESGHVDIKVSSLVALARVLGLELMLIPRRYILAVQAITSQQAQSAQQQPAYSLNLDGDEEEPHD